MHYSEITSEFIRITFLLGFVFAIIVTAFVCLPVLPLLSKVTSIEASSPASIGFLG